MSDAASIRARAHALGIMGSFTDIAGRRRTASRATLRAMLAALDAGDGIAPRRLVRPVVPSFEPAPVHIDLLAGGRERRIAWQLEGEGIKRSGHAQGSVQPGSLNWGYYTLTVRANGYSERALLVRAPARAWLPPVFLNRRGFGLAVQLYEMLGRDSIGIGDFSDLAGLARAAGSLGMDALGINPLHALYLHQPEHVSPYSPSSRLARNPLYLDVRRLPGMDDALRAHLEGAAFTMRVAALNAQDQIDYTGVSQEKLSLARAAWTRFCAAGGDGAFERFLHEAPEGVRRWADFEVLSAVHGCDARRWPARLREAAADAVRREVDAQPDERDFYLWLQWQCEAQLALAADATRSAGMGVGLYQDLALGADAGGAEVWAGNRDYVPGLRVGAPPDPLNPRGQDWGFPPLHPRRMQESGLKSFIALIRANMRHAGALRIDHVLGLHRLFVIPQGGTPAEGAYLRFPLEALLAVVALESQRAQCLVIGEDLGTVPRGLRRKLARRNIFSLRLLYFERSADGRPRAPDAYPRNALAAVGSHDLSPLPGWWRGADLQRMDQLGIWPDETTRAQAHASRPSERAALAEAFARAGLGRASAAAPVRAAYAWLARSASRLLVIHPEDALEIVAPVNVPGTVDEVPNWRRRRLPAWPQWLADPRFTALVRAVQGERGVHDAGRPPAPRATYRLQLHAGFGFAQAAEQAAYLARLGISHVYASPVLASVPGSAHGYDMVDPVRHDPARGGLMGFTELRAALRREGLALILDFVPNHMGAHAANPWWSDLLEWGHDSPHAASFDVDWRAGDGRIVVPVLAAELDQILAGNELAIDLSRDGRFWLQYQSHRLPLAPPSVAPILTGAARGLRSGGEALAKLARDFRALKRQPGSARRAAGLRLQAALAELAEASTLCEAVAGAARLYGADAPRLRRLLDRQHWRLAYWRHGLEEVNYRRFFDIASLAAVRLERPAVFAAMHERIRALVGDGDAAGLRLDHVDGLAAPSRYLATLADLCAVHRVPARLWVEKILGAEEKLPPWPVSGTTGYEFLNDVTRLLMPAPGAAMLRAVWDEVVPGAPSFSQTLAAAKHEAVEQLLAPMLERTVSALASRAPVSADVLHGAVSEAVVAVPVYRAYPDAPRSARAAQRQVVDAAAEVAARVDPDAGRWLRRVLGIPMSGQARLPARLRDGATRFWQLAAAAMAKGLEDTACYRDFALLALNEVGGDPAASLLDVANFHRRTQARARTWPAALNASATHDTKRGEDARMRLAMLAAYAEEWRALVPQLRNAAAEFRPPELHAADEYLVWQSLLAIWPPPCRELANDERDALLTRLQNYLVKALREGKQRTSWLAPNRDYEAGVCRYAGALLAPDGLAWRTLFLPFAARLARSGALASLSALVLKLTAPGIPDIYQGTELWDLSLVDPDNRRPVDYEARTRILDAIEALPEPGDGAHIEHLLANWPDGHIKFQILAALLALRQNMPQVFAEGAYKPLDTEGSRDDRVIAFARGDHIAVAVSLPTPDLEAPERCALNPAAWGDTAISLPGRWCDVFTGRVAIGPRMRAADLLAPLPVAVLVREPQVT